MQNNLSCSQQKSMVSSPQKTSQSLWKTLTVEQQEVTKGGYSRGGIIMPPNRRGTPGDH